MNETIMTALGQTGAFSAIAIAAFGSALGTGAACAAAIGAWKKCYAQNKPAPFQLLVFAGAPFSQTIYGMILMFYMYGVFSAKSAENWPLFLIVGIISGITMAASAWMQGKAAAGACSAFVDTGKGLANFLIALGIIETVAIFIMVFAMVFTAKLPDKKVNSIKDVPLVQSEQAKVE